MIQNIKTYKKFYVGGFLAIFFIGTLAFAANENSENKRRICHLHNDGTYQEMHLNASAWNGHNDHEEDLWDVEKGGCPPKLIEKDPNDNANEAAENVRRICHFNSSSESYSEMLLNANSWNGHNDHEEDLWDVDPGGCPTS